MEKNILFLADVKSGFFDIRTLDGEKVNKGSISYKKLKLLEISKGFLTERKIVA